MHDVNVLSLKKRRPKLGLEGELVEDDCDVASPFLRLFERRLWWRLFVLSLVAEVLPFALVPVLRDRTTDV